MKRYLILFFLLFSIGCYAQKEGIDYYVITNTLNVRTSASVDSAIVLKLKKYDNIIYYGTVGNQNWAKIDYNGKKGYVLYKYIKKGNAIVSSYSIRIAVCNDSTRSNATVREICSNHGGVAYWLTEQKSFVKIVNE